MRTTLILLLLIILSCSIKKGPVISYDNKIINLGSIEFEKAYNGKIVIKNTGDNALKLSEVSADCSCTVPIIQHSEILPGDTAYINFVLTPAQDGLIQQSIYVNNNSINENRVLFLIRAKVHLVNKQFGTK